MTSTPANPTSPVNQIIKSRARNAARRAWVQRQTAHHKPPKREQPLTPHPVKMIGTVTDLTRLTPSAQGNPQFRLVLTNKDTFGTYTCTTEPDSIFAYSVPLLLNKIICAQIRQDTARIVSAR